MLAEMPSFHDAAALARWQALPPPESRHRAAPAEFAEPEGGPLQYRRLQSREAGKSKAFRGSNRCRARETGGIRPRCRRTMQSVLRRPNRSPEPRREEPAR